MSRKKLKMRRAFSLIELIITLALSSILFSALMSFLYAIQKSANSYYKFVADDRVVNIGNYLFRDFSGAFVPTYDPNNKNFQDKEKRQLINDCFECKTDAEGRLQEIKFITNNYLPIYNANKSRVNRVIYKLEKDDDLFKLRRSKDYNLEDSNFDTFYTMLEQIKDCKIKLFQIVETENKNNENDENEVKILSNWSANKIYQDRDQKAKKISLLPQQIVLTITIQSEKIFEFLVPIFSYSIDLNYDDAKSQLKKEDPAVVNQTEQKQTNKDLGNNQARFPGISPTNAADQQANKLDDQMRGL